MTKLPQRRNPDQSCAILVVTLWRNHAFVGTFLLGKGPAWGQQWQIS
jgi:hypothetical protein